MNEATGVCFAARAIYILGRLFSAYFTLRRCCEAGIGRLRRAQAARLGRFSLFRSRGTLFAATALLCLVLFYFDLGVPALWDPDEGRYATGASEMLRNGNWLAPTYNGTPDHHKPILFYWLAAASMRAFGANEWALRLPSALAASACVASTAWWGMRFFSGSTGFLAALVLASTALFVGTARLAIIDMTFAALLSGAFLCGGAWCLDDRRRRGPPSLFWLLLSLATLAKGPVALVLAALLFVPYCWIHRIRIAALELLRGALIVLAAAGTWYVAISIAAPDYFRDFLWLHNIERYTRGTVGHRMNPLAYFYLLPLSFLPWALLLPLVPLNWSAARNSAEKAARDFCLLWIVSCFTFFSFSTTKLGTYLLPAFAPLALLLARAIAAGLPRAFDRRERLVYRSALCSLLFLQTVGAVAVAVLLLWLRIGHLVLAVLVLTGIPLTLLGFRGMQRHRRDLVVASIAAVMALSCIEFYAFVSPALTNTLSLKTAATAVHRLARPPRVLAYRARFQSLTYYLAEPVRVVDDIDDVVGALCGAQPTVVLTKKSPAREIARRCPCALTTLWSGERNKLLLSNRAL